MFEEQQEQQLAAQLADFEDSLANQREKENLKTKKMMDGLSKRKEELLAEAEKRKQEKLEALKKKGTASAEETEQIISLHQEEVQRLANKLDADKLRQQQKLEEQLNKRRRKQKALTIQQIKEKQDEALVDKDSQINQRLVSLEAESAAKIEKVIGSSGSLLGRGSAVPIKQVMSTEDSMELTVPLSENQLQELMSSSPYSSKIQGISDLIANTQQGMYSGIF